jgi:hypothetical protein
MYVFLSTVNLSLNIYVIIDMKIMFKKNKYQIDDMLYGRYR